MKHFPTIMQVFFYLKYRKVFRTKLQQSVKNHRDAQSLKDLR